MSADADREPDDRSTCRACRGGGRVISRFGGTEHEVPCPWCDGTGRWLAGHDAQEARRPASGA